jgi:hypothetical protein
MMEFKKAKLLIFVSLIFLVAITPFAQANETGVQRYRNYTPKQWRALPEKIKFSDVPIMYSFAAQKGLLKGSQFLLARELQELMYPGLSNYEKAVRQFQRDLGDKADGELTLWQISELTRRSEMQHLRDPGFPKSFHSGIYESFASVTGTMILLDEEIADPINRHQVKCYKSTELCETRVLSLVTPTDNSLRQVFTILEDAGPTYKITRWESDSIEAISTNPSACRVVSVALNFKTKEFYFITRNGSNDCEVLGEKFPRLAKPRIAQIVEGAKVINQKFSDLSRNAHEVTAKDFQARAKKWVEENTPESSKR